MVPNTGSKEKRKFFFYAPTTQPDPGWLKVFWGIFMEVDTRLTAPVLWPQMLIRMLFELWRKLALTSPVNTPKLIKNSRMSFLTWQSQYVIGLKFPVLSAVQTWKFQSNTQKQERWFTKVLRIPLQLWDQKTRSLRSSARSEMRYKTGSSGYLGNDPGLWSTCLVWFLSFYKVFTMSADLQDILQSQLLKKPLSRRL